MQYNVYLRLIKAYKLINLLCRVITVNNVNLNRVTNSLFKVIFKILLTKIDLNDYLESIKNHYHKY